MNNIELSPPWVTYKNELMVMFGKDPDIRIEYNETENKKEVKLFVDVEEKANALNQLLPKVKTFGNAILWITVVPANFKAANPKDILKVAFENNPVLKNVLSVPSPFGNMTYAVFAKEVVQFPNDEMRDPYGNKSTLYQDIATDLFEDMNHTFYCTDSE